MAIAETVSIVATSIAFLSSGGAWCAIYMTRTSAKDAIRSQTNIAARTSRANVVSANRQKWIDAIREDVSSFISARKQHEFIRTSGSSTQAGVDALLRENRELRSRVTMLQARIDMRLNHTEEDHLLLLSTLADFDKDCCASNDEAIRAISRKIFGAEWARLKKEASGIDPFVREAIPPRN